MSNGSRLTAGWPCNQGQYLLLCVQHSKYAAPLAFTMHAAAGDAHASAGGRTSVRGIVSTPRNCCMSSERLHPKPTLPLRRRFSFTLQQSRHLLRAGFPLPRCFTTLGPNSASQGTSAGRPPRLLRPPPPPRPPGALLRATHPPQAARRLHALLQGQG